MDSNRKTTLPELTPFKQCMREIGIAYTSGRDAAFRGELPVVKIGRAWYVDRRDAVRFIESCKGQPQETRG